MEPHSAYLVNWIYTHDGKACHGFWGEREFTLERAIQGVEWLKEHTENLVCAWVVRSEEQPDGRNKNVETPYLEVFVDAFGYPAIPCYEGSGGLRGGQHERHQGQNQKAARAGDQPE